MLRRAILALATLLALTALVAPAQAHGAAAAREIDTRLLVDNEGALPYAGCLEGQCLPGLEVEGLDLVVLEVREAYVDGQPAVVFRMIYQTDDTHAGRTVDLTLTAGGKEQTFTFATDGATPATGTFDKLAGPVEVFDGYPKAVDGYLKYSTLGVKSGDELTGIKLASGFEGEASDVLPGTWFAMGTEMPFIPNPEEPTEVEVAPPATYTLKGPAPLLDVTHDAAAGTLTIKNPLTSLPQFATLTAKAPAGMTVTLDAASLNLDATASRTVKYNVTGNGTGPVTITVATDLDAYTIVPLAVATNAANATGVPANGTTGATTGPHGGHNAGATNPATTSATSSQSATDHDATEHEHEETNDTPAPSALVAVLAVAAVALARRRSL